MEHKHCSLCCVLEESKRVKHERVNSVDLFDSCKRLISMYKSVISLLIRGLHVEKVNCHID